MHHWKTILSTWLYTLHIEFIEILLLLLGKLQCLVFYSSFNWKVITLDKYCLGPIVLGKPQYLAYSFGMYNAGDTMLERPIAPSGGNSYCLASFCSFGVCNVGDYFWDLLLLLVAKPCYLASCSLFEVCTTLGGTMLGTYCSSWWADDTVWHPTYHLKCVTLGIQYWGPVATLPGVL